LGPRSLIHSRNPQELTTVRVQDPRVHNEGSWNSYVDYKIFLHQGGLGDPGDRPQGGRCRQVPAGASRCWQVSGCRQVPAGDPALSRAVPRVLQSAVLLSDSRLHLFLQSQLPVAAIEACVQGRGPHSVTEAILHYAMAGCAWGQ
ncbi:SNX11 protein, partial [Copsychus sechellarum]|nr:SNX11 protein [Copsychus sechellarum]